MPLAVVWGCRCFLCVVLLGFACSAFGVWCFWFFSADTAIAYGLVCLVVSLLLWFCFGGLGFGFAGVSIVFWACPVCFYFP